MKTLVDQRTGISFSSDKNDIATFAELLQKAYDEQDDWINALREQGFKAAHCNDGWANKEINTLYMRYPIFNDGILIGDKVMIGNYYDKVKKAVIVTSISLAKVDFESDKYTYVPIITENKKEEKPSLISHILRLFGII